MNAARSTISACKDLVRHFVTHFVPHLIGLRRSSLNLPQYGSLASLVFAITSGVSAAAPETNGPARRDYSFFSAISERNIFNTTRRGHRSARSDGDNGPRVDTITLYGTFMYEKGLFAFFTGTSPEYSKVLDTGKSIAGYTIAEISGSAVKLVLGTNSFELGVGMQLRREEGGDWQVVGGSAPSVSSSATTAADTSGGDDNDVVKRMIKQRVQDLK